MSATINKNKVNDDKKQDTINEEYPELKALKKQYGEVSIIKVEDKYCYLRKPDRKVIGKCFLHINGEKQDILTAGEVLLRECWIGGSQDFLTDDDLILAASIKAFELVQFKQAELIKK